MSGEGGREGGREGGGFLPWAMAGCRVFKKERHTDMVDAEKKKRQQKIKTEGSDVVVAVAFALGER
jgi:hypothetical protein